MTTITLPITITIEVTGTFVPGNLHKVRDEEPQGDTFEDLDIEVIYFSETTPTITEPLGLTDRLIQRIVDLHRDEIIEALLAERSKSAP